MSGSVLILAGSAASALATAALIGALSLIPAAHQAQHAADAAALGAADAMLGLAAEEPCVLAERIATANAAELSSCQCTEDARCDVTAMTSLLGIRLESRSRAGPD